MHNCHITNESSSPFQLRETDEQLNRSSRLMNTMVMRALQDRFVLIMVFLVLGVLLCVAVYFYVT